MRDTHCAEGAAPQNHSICETELWTIRNKSHKFIVCRTLRKPAEFLVLIVEVDGEVIVRETQYTASQANERASRLREMLADWEHTA